MKKIKVKSLIENIIRTTVVQKLLENDLSLKGVTLKQKQTMDVLRQRDFRFRSTSPCEGGICIVLERPYGKGKHPGPRIASVMPDGTINQDKLSLSKYLSVVGENETPVKKQEPMFTGVQQFELAKMTPIQKKFVTGFEKRGFDVKKVVPSEDTKTISVLLTKSGGRFDDDNLLIGPDGSINGQSYKELPVFEGQPVGGVKNDHEFDAGRHGVMKAVNIGENNQRTCDCGSGLPSEWEYDAQDIPLCRACPKCKQRKLSKYRPEILRGYTQADVDEPIEPEDDRYEEGVQEKVGFDGRYVNDMESGVKVKKLHKLDETSIRPEFIYPRDWKNAKNYIYVTKLPQTDEFIVAWYENKRLNEDKSYYTNDATDAWNTFALMKMDVDKANRTAPQPDWVRPKNPVKEETGTGAVAGYQTPYAFSKKSGSKRALDVTTKMGYKKVKDID